MIPQPSRLAPPARARSRSFKWEIRTLEVPFMQPGPSEAALEGSSSCTNDCGCSISRLRGSPIPPKATR